MQFTDLIFNEVSEVEDFEEDLDTLWELAKRELGDDLSGVDEDERTDLIMEEVSSIVKVLRFKKDSLLYEGLLEWHGSEDNLLDNVRSAIEVEDDFSASTYIYFVTGTGYNYVDRDLLNGNGSGEATEEFLSLLNED